MKLSDFHWNSARLLRSIGTDDPYKLFLELEQMKKQWFFAQDTRQISKRKKLFQYIVDNRECRTKAKCTC